MSDQKAATSHCFGIIVRDQLLGFDRSFIKRCLGEWARVVQIAIPLAISMFAARYLITPGDGANTGELIFVDILKLTSIAMLAFHTQGALGDIGEKVPSTGINSFRAISIYMFIVVVLLVVHLVLLLIPQAPFAEGLKEYRGTFYVASGNQYIPISREWGAFIKSCQSIAPHLREKNVLFFLSLISFLYMFWFWIANSFLIYRNRTKTGVVLFTKAFINGVNIPFCVGFVGVVAISYATPISQPVFLAGATAFLVYASTAAAIYVDAYAKPFLEADRRECPIILPRQGPTTEV